MKDASFFTNVHATWGSFKLVTQAELKKAICHFSKHCEVDPLPTWLLKKVLPTIIPFLTHLVNVSLCTGVFPSKGKLALVSPLLKKPSLDYNNFKNFRPVS